MNTGTLMFWRPPAQISFLSHLMAGISLDGIGNNYKGVHWPGALLAAEKQSGSGPITEPPSLILHCLVEFRHSVNLKTQRKSSVGWESRKIGVKNIIIIFYVGRKIIRIWISVNDRHFQPASVRVIHLAPHAQVLSSVPPPPRKVLFPHTPHTRTLLPHSICLTHCGH